VLRALLDSVSTLVMPAFTYKTMITPEVGPPNNGLSYGSNRDLNRMAESFRQNMPVDPLMGILPETMRQYPRATRTAHPILSFTGINADEALKTQTTFDPFAPIDALAEQDGWVLLLGVDHTVNTSIHYAEKLAGRRQFVRWALSKNRVVECLGFPGCSVGFQMIEPDIRNASRMANIGESFISAVPLKLLIQAVEMKIKLDPYALLCQQTDCERCRDVRLSVEM
jgi:aminoglycoside 3-N-acetyltransferase